jgi:hypothetical protein
LGSGAGGGSGTDWAATIVAATICPAIAIAIQAAIEAAWRLPAIWRLPAMGHSDFRLNPDSLAVLASRLVWRHRGSVEPDSRCAGNAFIHQDCYSFSPPIRISRLPA